ncbi:MAG: transglutaminase family protein [Betaproteobacteria bacterium]|nr:transglutaminase family protein [Betaproteobacteria bacterium]
MKLSLVHETHYSYESPVRYSTQYLRLTPRDTARQKVLAWRLETPGQPVGTHDGYGNVLHVLTLDKPVTEIVIRAAGVVETARSVDEPSDFTGTPLSPLLFLRATALTRADDKLAEFAERFRRRAGTLSGQRELAAAAKSDLPGADAAAVVHRFIGGCRLLGVPARFVSGYICASGGTNYAAPHAWAEAWVVDRWRSFDIANDSIVGEGHIKVAFGADYNDACPIRGVRTGGGAETMRALAQIAQ